MKFFKRQGGNPGRLRDRAALVLLLALTVGFGYGLCCIPMTGQAGHIQFFWTQEDTGSSLFRWMQESRNDELHVLNIPHMNQREQYPTGCESVSAVMALHALGIDISVEEFIDSYLEQGEAPHNDGRGFYTGADPRQAFLGSPYDTEGWGCYAPVIVRALNRCLKDTAYQAVELSGVPLSDLCRDYICRNIPVIVWATDGMQKAEPGKTWVTDSGEPFTWVRPMHCLLLAGFDRGHYFFNDPLNQKLERYKKEKTETAYAALYMQAVVILSKESVS